MVKEDANSQDYDLTAVQSSPAYPIVAGMIEKTATAMITGDFDAFAACVSVPLVLETFEGVYHAETPDQLREIFEKNVAFYRENGVVDLDRTCTLAEFVSETKVSCVYQSRLIKADGTSERAPHHVFASLEKVDEAWKVFHAQYAITDSPEHNRTLVNKLNS